MIAIYYEIYKFNEESHEEGEIVLQNIVKDYECTIHPQQETRIRRLPYKCKLHKFKSKGYRIRFCTFNITRDYVKNNRIEGSELP